MLSSTQINRYYQREQKYGECLDQFALPKKLTHGKFYIVNLGPLRSGGTHWCLVSLLQPKQPFFFNSFGLPPDAPIVKAIRGNSDTPHIAWSDVDYQAIRSESCGHFDLFVADRLLHGVALDKVCNGLHKVKLTLNDKIVDKATPTAHAMRMVDETAESLGHEDIDNPKSKPAHTRSSLGNGTPIKLF